jgi:hypothetical protein
MIKLRPFVVTGIISLFYFSFPLFFYSSSGNMFDTMPDNKLFGMLFMLFYPAWINFYSMNFLEHNPYSYLVQFALFLLGWAILYSLYLLFRKKKVVEDSIQPK